MKFTPYPLGDPRADGAPRSDWRIEQRHGGARRIVLYPDDPDGWDDGIPFPSPEADAFIRMYGTVEPDDDDESVIELATELRDRWVRNLNHGADETGWDHVLDLEAAFGLSRETRPERE